MNYKIYFSPTGGTQKIVDFVSNQFQDVKSIDISLDIDQYQFDKSDFCIVGVPSFAGRVPAIALQRLKKMTGKNTRVLLIVTYGNRAYEDTLLELKETLEKQGFECIGAMTIVTMHSIVNKFGNGRPTDNDLDEIIDFIKIIKERLLNGYNFINVPGNHPYKDTRPSAMHPNTLDKCIECGLCARKCPVHAINIENPRILNEENCISCMRCVRLCPIHAKVCDAKMIESLSNKLEPLCSIKKENEFF